MNFLLWKHPAKESVRNEEKVCPGNLWRLKDRVILRVIQNIYLQQLYLQQSEAMCYCKWKTEQDREIHCKNSQHAQCVGIFYIHG